MIAGFGIIGLYSGMFASETYGSRLEEYIASHNPQNTYDVERLANEFDKQNSKGFL
jgi:hypothetical protein